MRMVSTPLRLRLLHLRPLRRPRRHLPHHLQQRSPPRRYASGVAPQAPSTLTPLLATSRTPRHPLHPLLLHLRWPSLNLPRRPPPRRRWSRLVTLCRSFLVPPRPPRPTLRCSPICHPPLLRVLAELPRACRLPTSTRPSPAPPLLPLATLRLRRRRPRHRPRRSHPLWTHPHPST
jgi:hypothetical protein